jgi:transcriptional regulator with XRE-family HTH domain
MGSRKLTPNQVVAYNLARARKRAGLTQEQAAERLEPFLGVRWSKAVFSAAERGVEGDRIRHFTADDVYALARGFELPVSYFLCPPTWAEEIGHPDSAESVSTWGWLDMVFDIGDDARNWLLRDVVPMTAATTRALRKWGSHFAATVSHRESEVAALAAAAGERDEES